MTKNEFQAACKLLNGFKIEEGKYYILKDGETVLIHKLFKNTLRYKDRFRKDLIINYYHEFIDKVKKRTELINKKFMTDLNIMIPKYYEDFVKKYSNENNLWTYPDGTKLN